MPGGAKRNPLGRHRGIGHLGIVGGDKARNIDQHSRRRRLAGKGAFFTAFPSLTRFELRHFRQTAAMAFHTAEARREKCFDQFPGKRMADDEAAEAMMLRSSSSTPWCAENVSWTGTPDAGDLAGGNRGSDSAAANGHAAIHFTARNGARKRDDKVRIVVVRL